MFDKTIVENRTTVTPVTRVVEKTITPDKVTDMYKDVRAEVEKSILRTVRVENNQMKGVVVEIHEDFANRQIKLWTRFTLNGVEHINSHFIERGRTEEELVNKLFEDYKTEVARELLKTGLEPIIRLR